MDLEPALKSGALRVRDALHRFAQSKGWSREDYRVFMTVNETWGVITVEFVARAYDGPDFDESARYDEALDYLERDLQDEPELYESIGLILRPFNKYNCRAYRIYGENIVELDEAILNPGVTDLRPPEGTGFF